ncbi:MAG TPA: hypoxanthine phosphoribosyltransferase [Pseudomonadota bacterium]|jgi:hypoxanthine phosphoribosyltransferase|nr:hypoxanthine phosphoribosyltransferase [Pseudomonadota bacterium]
MSTASPSAALIEPNLRELISREKIAARNAELGRQIAQDYAGKSLTVITVLKGSFVFAADLTREIFLAQRELGQTTSALSVEFLALQSYGDQTMTSGVVQITADLTHPIEGKHVLIVEDIVDTGLTMSYLLENLKTRRPASVKLCSLLHKPARTQQQVPIDYLGFTIDDLFVIGYGLDYKQRFRNMPHIAVLVE